jgi:hypothetical protein
VRVEWAPFFVAKKEISVSARGGNKTMHREIVRSCWLAALLAILLSNGSALAAGPEYRVLYRFQDSPDGSQPFAGLVMDTAGNLYGTTYRGGTEGTVFRLTRGSNGLWTESVLFDFSDPMVSGGFPMGGVTLDTAGNLYGTAGPGAFNHGVVFQLAPNSSGFWNVSVLHTFNGNADGMQPLAGVIFDKAGDLYGTTPISGPVGGSCGTVFQLTPSNGVWQENILHVFTCKKDGWFPSANLVFDKAGNLYGTTRWGGVGCGYYGCGTVFKLTPANGIWNKTTIYAFKGSSDGSEPTSTLVFDKAGNLYGTTSVGGVGPCTIEGGSGCGTVFKLTPRHTGGWKKTVIYSPDGSSGGGLFGGVVFDRAGNLYGTAAFYGIVGPDCAGGCGSVFKLTPGTGGVWSETTLYEFNGTHDGGEPFDSLVLDNAGNIYGTTQYGGSSKGNCQVLGCGVVFEIKP